MGHWDSSGGGSSDSGDLRPAPVRPRQVRKRARAKASPSAAAPGHDLTDSLPLLPPLANPPTSGAGSSHDGPARPAPPPPPEPVGAARAPRQRGQRLQSCQQWALPGGGHVRFDARQGQFAAHCPEESGHGICSKCKCDRAGHKGPLGFLTAWCEIGCTYTDREDHTKLKRDGVTLSFDVRESSRLWLEENHPDLCELEAALRDGDTHEPAELPQSCATLALRLQMLAWTNFATLFFENRPNHLYD